MTTLSKVTGFYITLNENGDQLVAIAHDADDNDVITVSGFDSILDCEDFARKYANAYGIVDFEIASDVWEAQLVEGVNIENRLLTRDDLCNGIMDILNAVEKGKIDNIVGTDRVMKIIDVYNDRQAAQE